MGADSQMGDHTWKPGSAIGPQIDRQVEFLRRCHSVFPRLDRNMAGLPQFEAPEYYRQLGYNAVVKLSEPMIRQELAG